MKNSTKRMIKKYGKAICVEAYEKHDNNGDGASTIGYELGFTTNTIDAMINAIRDIVDNNSANKQD